MANFISTLNNAQQISALYVGYYSRAADPVGFGFWKGVLDSGGLTLEQIAADFASQQESRNAYALLNAPAGQPVSVGDASVFVIQIYENIFNRVPDPAGFTFWRDALVGGFAPDQFILAIIDGAQGVDRTCLSNKIQAGLYWKDQAAATPGFTMTINSPERQEAQDTIASVDDTAASRTVARNRTDAYFAAY